MISFATNHRVLDYKTRANSNPRKLAFASLPPQPPSSQTMPLTPTPAAATPLNDIGSVCFPHASGERPLQKGQVTSSTTFGKALQKLAADPSVKGILEIGTWYGGGSTQSFVDGLGVNARCTSNATHHCCEKFIVTFEIFPPAWEYARRYHQDNPVWLVLGTTVGEDRMLQHTDIPADERGEHFRLYYERDKELMRSHEPQLEKYCKRLLPDVVLIDGNEYTGWGEFEVAMQWCRPKWLALHDTGTLKTAKIEAFILNHPDEFRVVDKGKDSAEWSLFAVVPPQQKQDYLFSDKEIDQVLATRKLSRSEMLDNDAQRREMFSKVYSNNVWTHGDGRVPKSGSGSTLQKTESTRSFLKEAVLRYNIRSIVDAPCGDLTWMRTLFPFFAEHGVKYTGVDIVPSEIAQHSFAFPQHTFLELDMAVKPLPAADLIFSRQALQHMNVEDNMRVMNNWVSSGSQFIMQTTYNVTPNSNYRPVSGGTNSLINLLAPPYNLPSPMQLWLEQEQNWGVEYLAIWNVSALLSPKPFKIIVMTQRRHWSLLRLLSSINSANYDGLPVHLDIRVDHEISADYEKTVQIANDFVFAHGTKTVHIYGTQQGLQLAWFNAWTPASDDERAVILEDDMELSPLWFKWLHESWLHYGKRNDLGGTSLCRQRLRASDGATIMVQHDAPFLYRVPGSFGFSPNAMHWLPFVKWVRSIDRRSVNIDVSGTVTTKWHRGNPDSWEQFWIWWCWTKQELYTLYVHSPNGALIAHWSEPGVHARTPAEKNDNLLVKAEPVLSVFPEDLRRFDWSFS